LRIVVFFFFFFWCTIAKASIIISEHCDRLLGCGRHCRLEHSRSDLGKNDCYSRSGIIVTGKHGGSMSSRVWLCRSCRVVLSAAPEAVCCMPAAVCSSPLLLVVPLSGRVVLVAGNVCY
jgi:hypothetical protein